MGIDWQKLKGNKGKGFEALAIEYLKKNFQGKWEQTKQTRDGNKDAISIIYINKEAWAEAKYTEKERLSRFRLDATIVSAIIGKNKVVELIFITNSQIDINTQNSIKTALSNSMGKSFRVSFRTKEDIEFWLFNNPDVFRKYFHSSKEALIELQSRFDRLRFTSPVNFYRTIRQSISFDESLDTLQVGETYMMLFSLFSPATQSGIKVTINSNKLSLLTKKETVSVSKGNNTINLKVRCVATGKIYRQHSLLTVNEEAYGEIEKKELNLKPSLNLEIESQRVFSSELLMSLGRFNQGLNSRYIYVIKGDGGTGKTALLEQLITSELFSNLDVIFQGFTHSSKDNRILLVNIVLLVLFYYLPSAEINEAYLKELTKENSFISSYLLELVKARDSSIDNLALKMLDYTKSEELFPDMVKLNRKVLILDDLHKLDEVSRSFLFSLITDINNSSVSCFIVLSGRTQFWNNKEFVGFIRSNRMVPRELHVTVDDVFTNLKSRDFNVDQKALSHIAERVNVNAIFILKLIEFLTEKKALFNSLNLDTKHVVINQFISDGDYTNKIISSFNELEEMQAELLNVVYFSISGILKNDLREGFDEILKKDLAHLVRYNEGRFIPFHDIYQDIYRKHYDPVSHDKLKTYLNHEPSAYDNLRNTLIFYEGDSDLNEIVEGIKVLEKTHQFYTIQYVLDSIFGDFANIKRRTMSIPPSVLLRLQFSYAVSVANCSRDNSGKDEFKLLDKNIRAAKGYVWKEGKVINEVHGNVIAELINSSFEHLQFKEVRKYVKDYNMIQKDAVSEGYAEEVEIHLRPGFLLVREIELLSSLAQDELADYQQGLSDLIRLCNEANDINKVDIIRIRVARSIVHKDIRLAFQYFKESAESLVSRKSDENKWIILAEFEMNFIRFQNGQCKTMKEIILSHQKLKQNFYNDYRKGYLVIAACYLVHTMKDKAYDYLHRDFFTKRDMRPRLKGLRLQLLALYEFYYNNNKTLAEEYIQEQKKIFSTLGESYQKIIEHNLNVINSFAPSDTVLAFFQEGNYAAKALYIDPRLW